MRLPQVFAVVLAVLTLLFARARYAPPEALPASAPAGVFSGMRAKDTLARVLGDQAPHPLGSDAAERVRERIVAELTGLGLHPEVQRAFTCSPHDACAFVANVVAELPGDSPELVVVSAHYDSVPASPGANDDGAGVAAVLEIARALAASPKLPRSVLFLLDEGEEDGLLGARAFAQHPTYARVRAAVNVDNRGSHGPSSIFETSKNSGVVAKLIAQSVARPVTSSLFFSVYERMPNDTDFSVFRGSATGANFAFVGHIQHYHTSLDRLENVNAPSLQHAGDGALAMVRALASADLGASGRRVWFDVLALGVVSWPEGWTLPMALAAVFLLAFAVATWMRQNALLPFDLVLGLGAIPLAVLLSSITSTVLVKGLEALGVLPVAWTANAAPAITAMIALGLASAAFAATSVARASANGIFCGAWLFVAAVSVLLTLAAPGASYVLVVPSFVAGLVAVALAKRPSVQEGSAAFLHLAPTWTMLVLFSPVLLLSYETMGHLAGPLLASMTAVVATTLAPLLRADRRILARATAGLAVAAAVFAIAAGRARPFSTEFPSRVNVVFAERAGDARVMIAPTWGGRAWGPVPDAMRATLPSATSMQLLPWNPEQVVGSDVTRIGLAPPEVTVEGSTDPGTEREMSLLVKSKRGARTLVLLLPPGSGARFSSVFGAQVTSSAAPDRWRAVRLLGIDPKGAHVGIAAPRTPFTLTVYDETPGVPASFASVVAARPSDAVPSQRGDLTLAITEISL